MKRYLTTDGTKISYSVWSKHKNQRRMSEVASADKPNVLFETKDLRIQYSAVQDNLVLNAIAGPDYIFAEAPSTARVNELTNNLPHAGLGSVKPAKAIDVELPPGSAASAQTGKGKAAEDVDRQVRRIQATLVETGSHCNM